MDYYTKSADEEIKNLFYFLGGSQHTSSIKETQKCSNLVFGLENYGLPIPADILRVIVIELEKKSKSKDGTITFEEFKTLWLANIETKFKISDLSKNLYDLIFEFISERDENLKEKHVNSKLETKLGYKELAWLLESMQLFDTDVSEEFQNDTKGINVRRHFNTAYGTGRNKYEELAKEMIKTLAIDGEFILYKDFEFLIGQYLNSLN